MILLWLSVFHKNMDMRLITNVYFGHISINDYQSRFLPKGWKKVYKLEIIIILLDKLPYYTTLRICNQ